MHGSGTHRCVNLWSTGMLPFTSPVVRVEAQSVPFNRTFLCACSLAWKHPSHERQGHFEFVVDLPRSGCGSEILQRVCRRSKWAELVPLLQVLNLVELPWISRFFFWWTKAVWPDFWSGWKELRRGYLGREKRGCRQVSDGWGTSWLFSQVGQVFHQFLIWIDLCLLYVCRLRCNAS